MTIFSNKLQFPASLVPSCTLLPPTASPALRMVLEAASEARKLETENAHLWKYSKHLLKYIKNQQKEINKSEK